MKFSALTPKQNQGVAAWLIIFCILVISVGAILVYLLYKIIKAANLDGNGNQGGDTNSVVVETSVSPFYPAVQLQPAGSTTNVVQLSNGTGFTMQYGLGLLPVATNLVLNPWLVAGTPYFAITDGVPNFYSTSNSSTTVFTISYGGTLWLVNEDLNNTNNTGFDVPNNGGLPTNIVAIQESQDLVNWVPIFTNLNSAPNQVYSFTDTNPGAPRMFYRAVYLTNLP